jgi:hypothetical protein
VTLSGGRYKWKLRGVKQGFTCFKSVNQMAGIARKNLISRGERFVESEVQHTKPSGNDS